jgi:hypothetical protein
LPMPKRACNRSAASSFAPVPLAQVKKRPSAAETVALARGAGKRRRAC